jgi:pSer/pThr/pTyr-binding forkhead associated (FHA) protein
VSPLTVTLTVANGPLVGQAYEFHEPAVHVLGRAAECYPRLPDELPYKDISRYHCLLSVNLPELRLLDLGSTNGTFVNGARLGPGADGGAALAGEPGALTLSLHAQATGWHALKDAGVTALADSAVLRVRVQGPPQGQPA